MALQHKLGCWSYDSLLLLKPKDATHACYVYWEKCVGRLARECLLYDTIEVTQEKSVMEATISEDCVKTAEPAY